MNREENKRGFNMVNNKLESIHNRIIEQVSSNMKSYGFPKTIGHIVAIIHYEGRPMNLDELAERTGMSKTRMSQVLREMVQLNIAEKCFVKGSRKDTYTVEKDYYQMFLSLFTQNWKNVVTRNRLIDSKILTDVEHVFSNEEITNEEKKLAQEYYEDTQTSVQFFDWVNRLVDFFESGEIFEHVPKKDSKRE